MSPATIPTPPDFALSSGRSVTHQAEHTPKGIRFKVETIGDNPLSLSTDEGMEYSSLMTEWINANGFLITRNTIL